MHLRIACWIFGLVVAGSGAESLTAAQRPNVLFIAIDDLRNDLGALGVVHARTPHLDQLARSSRLFARHYVQVPTCGASRCALLRGRYPNTEAHLDNKAIKDTQAEWAPRSLPAWWRRHGYRTYAVGKITHYPGGLTGADWNEAPEELPGAWNRAWIPDSPWKTAEAMMHGYANGKPRERGLTPPWEGVDGPAETYPDAWVASEAVAHLDGLAKSTEPWFFAVGFFKPHLPFAAPRAWHEQHANSRIPAPEVAVDARARPGWHNSNELRNGYHLAGRDPVEDPVFADELRRAYAGAISYVDAQVGRVMEKFNELGLAENTVVVLWSDHGFMLGEQGVWGKHTLYEEALRSPLMMRVPGMKEPGGVSSAVVQTVDIYPTLLELCDLPAPAKLDGRSLTKQLDDPAAESDRVALGFWRSGRTIRADRWRLTVYPEKGNEVTLFDLSRDPHGLQNIAAVHPEVVQHLQSRMASLLAE